MKKEDFVGLGISEELAEKAAEASKKELDSYVPRTRLNEEIQKKRNAEQSYETAKSQLETLKASAGNNEELKTQIKKLQDELKEKEGVYESQIADLRMTNAITAAIGSSARDPEIVASLLDKKKLILSEDGKVTGLDEQLKEIKESKAFLFNDDDSYPNVRDGGESGGTGGKRDTGDLFADYMNGNL